MYYITSKLATEFIVLYKAYCNAATEDGFDKAYNIILKRIQRNEETTLENSEAVDTDDKVDEIIQPIELNKYVLDNSSSKNTLQRQLKIVRYLEKYQQVYKEKYIKAQTNQLRYYSYNMSSASKDAYVGLKRQIQSACNDILTFFIKLGPFYNSYINRYNTTLLVTQNNLSIQFVNKIFYYSINTTISIYTLQYIYK